MNHRVAIAVLLLAGATLVFFPDDAPPDDADLRVAIKPVAESDNAYHDFTRLAAAIKLSKEEREFVNKLDAPTSDRPAVSALSARNEEALAHLAAFSRRAGYQDPNFRDASTLKMEAPIPQFWPP